MPTVIRTELILPTKQSDYYNVGGLQLNDVGENGWELISVVNGIAYFKRPVDDTDGSSLVELDPGAWTQDKIEKHFIETGRIGDQSIFAFRKGKPLKDAVGKPLSEGS